MYACAPYKRATDHDRDITLHGHGKQYDGQANLSYAV